MLRFDIPTRSDTLALGRRIARELRAGDLVILDGPLGSGKTFLTRAMCRALGLSPSIRVPSPTFTLVHEHPTEPPLSHADLYRLETPAQVRALGLDAQRDDGRVLVVEWGAPYVELLGGDALVVTLTLEPRAATLGATGARSRALLGALGG
ncbi:MAG TPA: tRNA (adenosine(37)-N6)-threonylcarbamoyltransferase complex ATPase subunit type 1 TsaE [Polyangiaceae bacterium]